MSATSPTRFEVLKDARKLAEKIGAVEDGNQFFEKQNGQRTPVSPHDLRAGVVQPEQICGVCIAGACALAQLLGGGPLDQWAWIDEAARAADEVLGDERLRYEGSSLSEAIADKGTPYVLAVLDRMVEREAERVAA